MFAEFNKHSDGIRRFLRANRPNFLDNTRRLELKSKLMTLYSKLKSLFFYGLKHQNTGLSTEEPDTLQNWQIIRH